MRQALPGIAFGITALLVTAGRTSAEPPMLEVKHGGPVLALAWSADGKFLASAGEEGIVRVNAFPSGQEICQLPAATPISGVVFAADDKTLGVKASVQDGPLAVWELATKKQLRKLSFPGYTCNHLAFAPDGGTLVASGPGEYMVWNHAKGGGYGSRQGKFADGSFAAASPNGLIVAWSTPDGAVNCYYTDNRKFQRMKVSAGRAMAFTPDAKSLAVAAADKTIRIWEVNGPEVKKLEGLREPATMLHFSANGKLLAAASPTDPVVRLWDVGTGFLRRRLTTNPVGVKALALAPDGHTIALATGDKVLVWSVATRELGELGPPKRLEADEMRASWDDLSNTDLTKADAAFRKLASAGPYALEFLAKEIRAVAVPPIDWKRIDELLKDLDSSVFSDRHRASVELAKFGELIQVPVQKYLVKSPSLEASRRAAKLLDRLQDPPLTPDRLRALEAIELLELLRTPEARKMLEDIAHDSLIAQIRLAAGEALERLKRADAATSSKKTG